MRRRSNQPVESGTWRLRQSRFRRCCIASLLGLLSIALLDPHLIASADSTFMQRGPSKKRTQPPMQEQSTPRKAQEERRTQSIPRTGSIVPDSSSLRELADGIAHRRITTRGGHIINLVTIDLKRGGRLRTCKAFDSYDGLEAVRQIFARADSSFGDTVIAATNASFWRATYNSPIGVTIADGEVVEMPGYKEWSSLLLHNNGTAEIDRVTLSGELVWKRKRLPVAAVNRRFDEEGLVVYNHYYGDAVPRGTRKSDSAIIAEVLANRVIPEIGDQTETKTIDSTKILQDYRTARAREDQEHPLLKIACIPPPHRRRDSPSRPSVGSPMKLIVTVVDTGTVAIPPNGFVISTGSSIDQLAAVQPGDTITLLYMLTPQPADPVRDVITGTPRLVRDGKAAPEYSIEGSHAQRFVQGELSRTAVGISLHGDTLFLATVDSPDRAAGTTGMTLAQIAGFMQAIGAYQAMNFDGGGSATMVIGGETISRQGGRPFNRRVSNALVVVKKKAEPFERRSVRGSSVEGP
jgi:hypothetical protein